MTALHFYDLKQPNLKTNLVVLKKIIPIRNPQHNEEELPDGRPWFKIIYLYMYNLSGDIKKKLRNFHKSKQNLRRLKTTRQTRTVSRKATRALSVQQCFSSSSSSSSPGLCKTFGTSRRSGGPPRRWRPIVSEWLNTHEGLVSVIVCYSFAVIH